MSVDPDAAARRLPLRPAAADGAPPGRRREGGHCSGGGMGSRGLRPRGSWRQVLGGAAAGGREGPPDVGIVR